MQNDPHIARVFDRDLEAVQAMIMRMGGLVEAALADAAKALETQDEALAEQVRRGDAAIDALEEMVNAECARLDVAARGGEVLEAVGERMNLTRERIRQIEAGALEKVRLRMFCDESR